MFGGLTEDDRVAGSVRDTGNCDWRNGPAVGFDGWADRKKPVAVETKKNA